MSNPEIGAGNVVLQLGDETITLTPTLDACIQLTSAPEGLFGTGPSIYNRINQLDIRVMARVVRLGAGIGANGVKDLESWMWKAGLANLRDPLIEFIENVISGGRKPEAKEDDGQKADPPPADA